MRTTNHILLDFESKKSVESNWSYQYIFQKNNYFTFLLFFNHNNFNSNLLNNSKYTVNYCRKVKQTNDYTFYNTDVFNKISDILLSNKKTKFKTNINNQVFNLININFLRKERLYTKLKYSRSPAYDMVSGGAAALFAAFLGFLISEKYGFELVDSGDFYYLFMYLVFLTFAIKPFLTSISSKDNVYQIFSLKPFFNFYFFLFFLILKKFK